MEQFEYKSLLAQQRMTLEELKLYYKNLRKYEYETDKEVSGIDTRKKMYHLLKQFFIIDKIINRRTVKVIGDKRIKNSKPKIYACTHIARYDIESVIEAVNESAWFIMGDPGETYRNLDGLILRGFGVSWFEMDDKFDAHTVNVRQKKILNNGGNEICFPEAAWHLDPIYPVGELNPKVAKRAIETGADIVPVAVEQYQVGNIKKYYVNIGKNISVEGTNVSDADEITKRLWDSLVSLKWEIFEKYGQSKRKQLDDNWEVACEKFINSIMCDTENGYTIEEIEKTKYKSDEKKPESPLDVFSYLNNIELNQNNAFLAKPINEYNKALVLKK